MEVEVAVAVAGVDGASVKSTNDGTVSGSWNGTGKVFKCIFVATYSTSLAVDKCSTFHFRVEPQPGTKQRSWGVGEQRMRE